MYKYIYRFWMALATVMGIIAFAGIVFMTYQIVFNGVTI